MRSFRNESRSLRIVGVSAAVVRVGLWQKLHFMGQEDRLTMVDP